MEEKTNWKLIEKTANRKREDFVPQFFKYDVKQELCKAIIELKDKMELNKK
jgi:hypothetical protein